MMYIYFFSSIIYQDLLFIWLSGPLLNFYAFSFQVITVPFPFQSLMKLLLLCMTSGLLLYASPAIVAAVLPHPLQTDQLFLTLLSTMGVSVLIPMLFRYRFLQVLTRRRLITIFAQYGL